MNKNILKSLYILIKKYSNKKILIIQKMAKKCILPYSILGIFILSSFVISSLDLNHENNSNNNKNKQRQLILSSIIENPIVDTVIDYLTGNNLKIYSSYKGYIVFACKNSSLESKYDENDKSAQLIYSMSLNGNLVEKIFDIEMNTCNDQDSNYVLCTLGVAISYASNENNNFMIYTYTMPYEIFDQPINDSLIEFFFKLKYKGIAYTCTNIEKFYYTFRNTPIVFSPYPDYVSYNNSLEFPIIFNDKSNDNDDSKYFSFNINEDTSSDTVINIPFNFIKAICISKYCIREINISFIKLDYSSPNYLIKINEVRNLIDKDQNFIPPGYYSDIIVYSSIGLLEISNSNKRYPLINTQGVCNLSERYFLKVYPLITSISKNQGFSTGYQDITIIGEGLCGELTDDLSSCKSNMTIFLGIDSDENKNNCLIKAITTSLNNEKKLEIYCITTDSYNFTESNITKTSIGVEYHDNTQLTNIELFMGTYSTNTSEATKTIYYKSRINFNISEDHNIKYSHYISAFKSFDLFLVNEENQTELAYSKQSISSNPYYQYDYEKESINYIELLPRKYYDTFNDSSKTNLSTTTSILQSKVGGIIYKNINLNPCNNNFIKTTLTLDITGVNKIDVYQITENLSYTLDKICNQDSCEGYRFELSEDIINSYRINIDTLTSTYFSLYLAFNSIKEVQNNFYIESFNQKKITIIFNFNTEKKYYFKCSNNCSFDYDISNIFIGKAYLDRSLPPELYRRPKPSDNTKGYFLINFKNSIINYDFSWEPLCSNKNTNCDFTFDFEDADYSITEIIYNFVAENIFITFNSIIPIAFHEKLKMKVGYYTFSFKDKVGYNGLNKYSFGINSENITETINGNAIKHFAYIFHTDYGRVKDTSNYNYCSALDIVHDLEFLNKDSGTHSGYCTCSLGFDEDNSSCKCPCDFRKADKSCSNCSLDQYYNEGECVDICPIYKKAVDDECKYCDYCSTDEFIFNNKCYSDSDCLNICYKGNYTDENNNVYYYCKSCGESAEYAYNDACVQSCYSSTIISKMNCFGLEYKYCQQCLNDYIFFDNSCITSTEIQDWMIMKNDEINNPYLDYCKEKKSFAFYKEANTVECHEACPEHTILKEVTFNQKTFNVCDYCGKNDSNYSFFYKNKCVQSCSPGLIQGNDDNGLKYCLSCDSNQLLNKSTGECLDKVESICPKSYINNETELKYDDNTTEIIFYCSVCESGYEYNQSCISTCIDGSILIPNESNNFYCSDCPEDKKYAYNNECYDSCFEGLAYEYNSNNERYQCYECVDNKKVLLGECVDSCPKASIEISYNSNNLNTNYCKLCSNLNEVVYNSTCLTDCPRGSQKILDNTFSIGRNYCEVCSENQFELEGSCEANCPNSTEKIYNVMKNLETNSNYCVLCSSPKNLLYINECVSECCESCIQNGLICTPTDCVDNTQKPLFYNGQCYETCPDQTKKLSTGNYCESCDVANGYIYVQNNTCVKECDIKAYKVNHSCLLCENKKISSDETGCVDSCDSENEVYDENTNRCILCNKFIFNNTCVTSCPTSSSNYYTQNKKCVLCNNYLDETYNTCRDSCLSNQFTNIDLKQCITCSSTKPYYFKDANYCVSNCPENYGIINSNSKICQDVSSMYILNNQYVSTCPKGYLANSSRVCYKCSEINKIDFYNTNGDVIDCIDSCSNGNNIYQINSNCYSCNSSLFKISNNNVVCVDSCSEGYIKAKLNNNSYFQCEKCPYYYNLNNNITTCVSKCGDNMISNSNNKCITCKEAGLLSLDNKCVQSCNQDEYSIENTTCILKTITCISSLNYCNSNGDCKEKKDDSNNIVLYCICKTNYYGLNCEYPESEYQKYIDNVINTIDSLSKITTPLTTSQLNEINELLNLINNNSTLLSTIENDNSDFIEEMLTISETQLELVNDNKANVTDSLLMLVDSSLTLNNNYNNTANNTNVKSELKELSSSLALNQDQFETYLSTKNSSVLYSGTTFSIQITDNSETNLQEAVEYSLPIINYTECEKVLHELGYLKSNESIYISNIQFW